MVSENDYESLNYLEKYKLYTVNKWHENIKKFNIDYIQKVFFLEINI